MATSLNPSATADIVARANTLFEDLSFTSARKWKAEKPGRKVIGYMPIYVPREIIHAADMMPITRAISAAFRARPSSLACPAASILSTACCSRRFAT